MVEVDIAEAASRFQELMDAALDGQRVVISRKGDRVALEPIDPLGDAEAHLAALRTRIRGPNPPPTEAELDADIAAMRGGADHVHPGRIGRGGLVSAQPGDRTGHSTVQSHASPDVAGATLLLL